MQIDLFCARRTIGQSWLSQCLVTGCRGGQLRDGWANAVIAAPGQFALDMSATLVVAMPAAVALALVRARWRKQCQPSYW